MCAVELPETFEKFGVPKLTIAFANRWHEVASSNAAISRVHSNIPRAVALAQGPSDVDTAGPGHFVIMLRDFP